MRVDTLVGAEWCGELCICQGETDGYSVISGDGSLTVNDLFHVSLSILIGAVFDSSTPTQAYLQK